MYQETMSQLDAGELSPLASNELYRGSDLDAVQRSLAFLFEPGPAEAAIRAADPAAEGDPSVVRGLHLTHLTLANMRFGVDTHLTIAPQNAYLLTMPREGEVTCYFGARRVRMAAGHMTITHPGESTLIPNWPGGVEALCIQIKPGALESELSAHLGRPVGLPRLASDLDLSTSGGRSFSATLALLLRELTEEDSVGRRSRVHTDQIQRLVLSTLLRVVPHEMSAELSGDVAPARWRAVRRAVRAIEDAPERAWMLSEICAVAGVGGRRLQQGFSEQIGMPPMAYLQVVRLQRVREDLLNGAENIGQCAARWGFAHPGRFSAAYRERYGETPRETRRRSGVVTFDLRRTA